MSKIRVGIFLGSVLTSFISGASHAAFLSPNAHWFGDISGGPGWERAGNTQTMYLAPNIEKTYQASDNTNTIGIVQLFGGIQENLQAYNYPLILQLGIDFAYSGTANPKGNIWDDANALFNNYSYQYHINHTHIGVKGKLLTETGYWGLMPWISVSTNVGFNHAYGFTNTPLISAAVVTPNFNDNTQTAFTYTVGVGLQKQVDRNWQVGLGYELADWGNSALDKALGQTLNQGLVLNHLYTNSILFNLTYIA